MNSFSHLFEPITISSLKLRNRIVMPPMAGNMGIVTERARAYYRERARGGVGLVIVEAAFLHRFESDEFLEGLAELSEPLHREGVGAILQLFQTDRIVGSEPVAHATASTAALRKIPAAFARAARLSLDAGLDGVEVHGAHGYFFNRFFSPLHNTRDDEYGGTLQRRMRLGLDAVRAIREIVGAEVPIFYRHTPVEGKPGGYTLEDTLAFVVELEKAGLDVIDISPSTGAGSGVHADLAAAVKKVVHIPVIAVGGMNVPEQAERALADGKCDLIAIGRGLLADPHWPKKVREGRVHEIIECVECNEKCFGNLSKGIPISCTQNERTGFEFEDMGHG